MSFPRKIAPKWHIVFLHVTSTIAQKTLNLVETAYAFENRYCFISTYIPYTQFPKNILSILVTFGLIWLQLIDTYRKFNPKLAKERADNSK